MAAVQSGDTRPLPKHWKVVGSGVVVLHFLAIGMLVLSANSGPWPTSYGSDMAIGPQFATTANNVFMSAYLQPLHMTHNYHFLSNRSSNEIQFEVRLKNESGRVIKTLRFPDADANFWVRHRQKLLADNLGNDQPTPPRGAEKVASADQEVKMVHFWLPEDEVRKLIEKNVLEPDFLPPPEAAPIRPQDMIPDPMNPGIKASVPTGTMESKDLNKFNYYLVTIREDQEGMLNRNMQLNRPSEWAMLVSNAYMRYLCREHNADSAELIRHSREPIYPAYMFMATPPPNTFTEMVANFGEYHTNSAKGQP